MNRSHKVSLIATLVLLGVLAGEVAIVKATDRLNLHSSANQALYIQSPKALRRMSLGYTGLLAEIYWTRAVQYFGYQHHLGSGDYHLLAPLLEVTTELDPRLLPPYQLGANFLAPQPPHGAGMPQEALRLLQYGIAHNPDQWRLYYELGFLYYTEFNDYGKAAAAFEAGAKLPNTHRFMPVLAARMAQHAGEFYTARMLWYTTYQSSDRDDIRQNAMQHLVALRVDEDVTHLEAVVEKYGQQFGHPPASMEDVEQAGFIRGHPVDPNGKPYKITVDGRVEVRDPEIMLYVTKGIPPTATTPKY